MPKLQLRDGSVVVLPNYRSSWIAESPSKKPKNFVLGAQFYGKLVMPASGFGYPKIIPGEDQSKAIVQTLCEVLHGRFAHTIDKLEFDNRYKHSAYYKNSVHHVRPASPRPNKKYFAGEDMSRRDSLAQLAQVPKDIEFDTSGVHPRIMLDDMAYFAGNKRINEGDKDRAVVCLKPQFTVLEFARRNRHIPPQVSAVHIKSDVPETPLANDGRGATRHCETLFLPLPISPLAMKDPVPLTVSGTELPRDAKPPGDPMRAAYLTDLFYIEEQYIIAKEHVLEWKAEMDLRVHQQKMVYLKYRTEQLAKKPVEPQYFYRKPHSVIDYPQQRSMPDEVMRIHHVARRKAEAVEDRRDRVTHNPYAKPIEKFFVVQKTHMPDGTLPFQHERQSKYPHDLLPPIVEICNEEALERIINSLPVRIKAVHLPKKGSYESII